MFLLMNFITVTSFWARWRLKSPVSLFFAEPFIQGEIKENIEAPRNWLLWGEPPAPVDAPTKGQWRGKMFPFDDVIMFREISGHIESAPSHYLNQWWIIVNQTIWYKLRWNRNQNWEHVHSRKCAGKRRLWNGGHLVSPSMFTLICGVTLTRTSNFVQAWTSIIPRFHVWDCCDTMPLKLWTCHNTTYLSQFIEAGVCNNWWGLSLTTTINTHCGRRTEAEWRIHASVK